MGISIREFQVAMETFGASRLPDRKGSRYNILVPCFKVRDVEFLHSGSYYIVQRGNEVPGEIMGRAMAEVGEKHPGGDNFWWGEIHSIRGILTLAAMLEGRYSKNLMHQLINKTYQKLLDCSVIKSNEKTHFSVPKTVELCKLLVEFDNIVNPFGNSNLRMKKPAEYLEKVKVGFSSTNKGTNLSLAAGGLGTSFQTDLTGWSYSIDALNDVKKGEESGCTSIIHYFSNGKDNKPVDEVISLYYRTGGGYKDLPGDIDLRISMKSGLAWTTYHEQEATSAADSQIETVMTHLKRSIERAKKNIVDYMVK